MIGVVGAKFDAVFRIGEEIKIELKISVPHTTFYVYRKVGLPSVKAKIVVVVDGGEIEKELLAKEVVPAEGGRGVAVGEVEEKVAHIAPVSQYIAAKIGAHEDAIAIRPIMLMPLSFDHRLIDGAVADQFMSKVKRGLEAFSEDLL